MTTYRFRIFLASGAHFPGHLRLRSGRSNLVSRFEHVSRDRAIANFYFSTSSDIMGETQRSLYELENNRSASAALSLSFSLFVIEYSLKTADGS